MSRVAKGISIVLALGAGLSCDPRRFSDLENETWVQFAERNDSQVGGSFGVELAAIPMPTGMTGARFVVASASPTGVSQVTFDQSGAVSEQIGSPVNASLAPLQSMYTIFALAPFTNADGSQSFAVGQVMGGTGSPGSAAIMPVGLKNVGTALTYPTTDDASKATSYGFGVVTGDFGSTGSGGQDTLVVSDNAITLFPGNPAVAKKSCYIKRPNTSPAGYAGGLHNAVFAPLKGNGKNQLVIGVRAIRPGVGNDIPMILILDASDIVDNTNCPTNGLTLSTTDGEPTAQSVVVGDFDGNGKLDIGFARTFNATDNKAGILGVYMNPTDFTNASATIIPTMADDIATTAFGSVIVAADMDNDGKDELIVSDPGAAVNNVSQSGQVFVYESGTGCTGTNATRGSFCISTKLFNPSPASNGEFGQAIVTTPFPTPTSDTLVLAIAETNKIWVYFKIFASAADPRM